MEIINGLHPHAGDRLSHFSGLIDIAPSMPTFLKLLKESPSIAEVLSRFEGNRLELARAIAYSLICPLDMATLDLYGKNSGKRAIANYLDLFPLPDIPDLVTLIVLIDPDVTIYTNRDEVIDAFLAREIEVEIEAMTAGMPTAIDLDLARRVRSRGLSLVSAAWTIFFSRAGG